MRFNRSEAFNCRKGIFMNDTHKIPVLFLIFKRKDTALKAFESIKAYQPERLYIAADGPRTHVAGEKEECEATRKAILESIDWNCDVKTLFRDSNLGCTNAVYGGISWFFENEECGIINEDDVVLSPDFYKLCEVLLPKYKDEDKVMIISSRNHSGKNQISNEYFFTQFANIWGWATWKRAWEKNPNEFEGWKDYPRKKLFERFGLFQGWMTIRYYNACSNPNDKMGSWDYTWSYIINKNDGICICPGVNLSTNVGIGVEGSTNYEMNDDDPYSKLGMGQIQWPLKDRTDLMLDKEMLKMDKKEFFRLRMIGLKKKIRNIISGR